LSVQFILARYLPEFGDGKLDLYEAIKTGKKKVEYRTASDYWARRLLNKKGIEQYLRFKPYKAGGVIRFTYYEIKHHTAIFRVGYTKTPTLHVDINSIIWNLSEGQFEIYIENVVEVVE